MKTSVLVSVLCLFLMAGCGSNPSRTQRGGLLDDKVTTQRVEAALQRSGASFAQVRAGTTNGVVVLSGSVASNADRARAEAIARSVGRVKDLKDEVQVVPAR